MKDIKFRLWNPERKVLTGGLGINTILLTTDREFVNDFEKSGMIWMQYTGLKDKNGKEIYEGDIVRYRSFVRAVFWGPSAYVIELPAQTSTGCFDTLLALLNDECEVIGNIYENPSF